MRKWNKYEKIILTLNAVTIVLSLLAGMIPGAIVSGLVMFAVWRGVLKED